mgnify:FL=1
MLLFAGCLSAQDNLSALLPMPNQVKQIESKKDFIISGKTTIQTNLPEDAFCIAELKDILRQRTGKTPTLSSSGSGSSVIRLILDPSAKGDGHYLLSVSEKTVSIKGATQGSILYGLMTLDQILLGDVCRTLSGKIAPIEIDDQPRFSYRSLMLDPARHFLPTEDVKFYIDQMVRYKYNVLQLHLTDDQGWRIEIKKHPWLTGKGEFYTQEELKDLVRYAAERNVQIIPELDIPGHTVAVLAAYPELGCTGGPYEVWRQWGVSEDVLCAGNDQVLKFLEDVYAELIEIFPSEYIHVGGDECPKVRWEKCPKCQARIKALGLKSDDKHSKEERLQSFVINHIEKFLNDHGRQIIGWDEILEGGLAPNATVMSWRGEGGGIEAAKQKHDVIMSPNTYLYFDYYQSKDVEQEPEAIGGYLPLERVYSYEPMPASLTPEEQKYIKGVQANLWTEYIPTFSQVEYMELPRMAALADIQWTNPEHKDYQDFLQRLVRMVKIYDVYQYNYAKHVFDVTARFEPNAETGTVDVTLSTVDNCPVYYTLDGTDPTTASQLYTEPVKINTNCTFKAMAVRPTGNSRIVKEDIAFSKSTSKKITALQPVNKQYEFAGISTLVDGLKGNRNYKTGRWIAFYKNDMEAVIDFGQPADFSKVTLTTNVEKGDWIFDARSISVAVSEDGENFKQVASEEYPAMTLDNPNQLYEHVLSFEPVKARYLKVLAKPEYNIPSWHGGKGNPAFLFVDEITVD